MTSFGFFEILVILVFALLALDLKHVVRGVRWIRGIKKRFYQVHGEFQSQMSALIFEQETTEQLESTPNTPQAMRNWGLKQVEKMPRQSLHHASAEILEQLNHFEPYLNASSIGAFYGSLDEVDTHKLLQHILTTSKTLYLPYCEGEEMHFAPIHDLNRDLVSGAFGMMEPIQPLRTPQNGNAKDATLPTPVPELLLIPGRTFDQYGGRIGRGKGFYDRYLTKTSTTHPILKVGMAFDVQISQKKLELLPHDQKMDYLISEKRVLSFVS